MPPNSKGDVLSQEEIDALLWGDPSQKMMDKQREMESRRVEELKLKIEADARKDEFDMEVAREGWLPE